MPDEKKPDVTLELVNKNPDQPNKWFLSLYGIDDEAATFEDFKISSVHPSKPGQQYFTIEPNSALGYTFPLVKEVADSDGICGTIFVRIRKDNIYGILSVVVEDCSCIDNGSILKTFRISRASYTNNPQLGSKNNVVTLDKWISSNNARIDGHIQVKLVYENMDAPLNEKKNERLMSFTKFITDADDSLGLAALIKCELFLKIHPEFLANDIPTE